MAQSKEEDQSNKIVHNNSADELLEQLKEDLQKLREKNEKRRVILIPVDSSKSSIYAVEWACKEILKEDDIIILFTCWENSIDFSSPLTGLVEADPLYVSMIDSEQIEENNQNHLKNSKHLLQNIYHQYFHKNHHVLSLLISAHDNNKESVGKVIVDCSLQLKIDLIILGSRGLGAIQQFFMGSVSKFVVEHSHVPVLVVKS